MRPPDLVSAILEESRQIAGEVLAAADRKWRMKRAAILMMAW